MNYSNLIIHKNFKLYLVSFYANSMHWFKLCNINYTKISCLHYHRRWLQHKTSLNFCMTYSSNVFNNKIYLNNNNSTIGSKYLQLLLVNYNYNKVALISSTNNIKLNNLYNLWFYLSKNTIMNFKVINIQFLNNLYQFNLNYLKVLIISNQKLSFLKKQTTSYISVLSNLRHL